MSGEQELASREIRRKEPLPSSPFTYVRTEDPKQASFTERRKSGVIFKGQQDPPSTLTS